MLKISTLQIPWTNVCAFKTSELYRMVMIQKVTKMCGCAGTFVPFRHGRHVLCSCSREVLRLELRSSPEHLHPELEVRTFPLSSNDFVRGCYREKKNILQVTLSLTHEYWHGLPLVMRRRLSTSKIKDECRRSLNHDYKHD